METERRFSVSQISSLLKECFNNPGFKGLVIYGEVYSIRRGSFTYIELGDQGENKKSNSPILKCAFKTMYGGDRYGLSQIKEGDVVEIKGNLSYYEHGSAVTFWGDSINVLQTQEGKSLLERKRILNKLKDLGYLDEERKKKIPKYVSKVALITSKDSAAYHDIIDSLHNRFPVTSVLYPAIVQGENAPASVSRQLKRAIESDCEVIIIGRGGGGKGDLAAFDNEKLAMQIAESPKPIITCIGHEIDKSVADFVSDQYAKTPTAGGDMINPSLKDTYDNLNKYERDLADSFERELDSKVMALDSFAQRLESLSPSNKLDSVKSGLSKTEEILTSRFKAALNRNSSKLDGYGYSLSTNIGRVIQKKKESISFYENNLAKLDTSKIAKLGYAKITKNGVGIKSYADLEKGDEVTISFEDGHRTAEIKE